jgi:hypothetical protein
VKDRAGKFEAADKVANPIWWNWRYESPPAKKKLMRAARKHD